MSEQVTSASRRAAGGAGFPGPPPTARPPPPRAPPAGVLEQLRNDVGAGPLGVPAGSGERGVAGATADVQQPLPRPHLQVGDELLAGGHQADADALVVAHRPQLAGPTGPGKGRRHGAECAPDHIRARSRPSPAPRAPARFDGHRYLYMRSGPENACIGTYAWSRGGGTTAPPDTQRTSPATSMPCGARSS